MKTLTKRTLEVSQALTATDAMANYCLLGNEVCVFKNWHGMMR